MRAQHRFERGEIGANGVVFGLGRRLAASDGGQVGDRGRGRNDAAKFRAGGVDLGIAERRRGLSGGPSHSNTEIVAGSRRKLGGAGIPVKLLALRPGFAGRFRQRPDTGQIENNLLGFCRVVLRDAEQSAFQYRGAGRNGRSRDDDNGVAILLKVDHRVLTKSGENWEGETQNGGRYLRRPPPDRLEL